MQIVYKKLHELTPYDKNPRINDKAVEVVANSILEYGFKNPIVVDENNVIINGHTRYLASTVLELEEVPVIVADDLTPAQVKAFRIMDNKSSEFAEWDYELLFKEIEDIKLDLDTNIEDLTGFSDLELAELDKAFNTAVEETAEPSFMDLFGAGEAKDTTDFADDEPTESFKYDENKQNYVFVKLVFTPEEAEIVEEFIAKNSNNGTRAEELLVAMIKESEV